MKERGEGTVVYKGFHLVDGVPVCDIYSKLEYPVGITVEVENSEVPLELCVHGIHVCMEPLDCFRFYPPCDVATTLGVARAFSLSDETDFYTSKRVAEAICVDQVFSGRDSYFQLSELVRSKTTAQRRLIVRNNVDGTGSQANNVVAYDKHLWLYGYGWAVGDSSDVLITAGSYSCVCGLPGTYISVALTFGLSSAAAGQIAIGFGSANLARSVMPRGAALTVKCSSIAVAENAMSLAVVCGTYSRAVANSQNTTAVGLEYLSLVELNAPGSVGVAYGSAIVKAPGCTVVLMPMRAVMDKSGSHYYGSGSVQGVDGTYVVIYDVDRDEWCGVYLRDIPDYPYPANKELDIGWLASTIRRRKNENHS